MRIIFRPAAFVIILAAAISAQHSSHKTPETAAGAKPIELVATDATTHRKVATSNKQAQAFFDQGLTLYYAFNDGDAVRSFRRAAELDPKLAMAYWGIALAAYPRLTGGGKLGDPARLKEAREAMTVAMSMPAPASDRVYVEALSILFSDDESKTLNKLGGDYRIAMKAVYAESPKDPNAAALYALSIFYTQGFFDWTPDGKPIGNWQEMIDVLEAGLKLDPKHLGLTHIYIHAIEGSLQPERALAAADTLRGLKILIPSFGHLVHMPAHIYVRTGNFQKSIESNEATATMPTDTLSDEFRLWHYGHVLGFLLFSYSMQGNDAKTSQTLDRTFIYSAPRSSDQRPRYWVRFHRWTDILASPLPPPDSKPQALANWAWARTMAYIATGDIAKAELERTKNSVATSMMRVMDDARIDAAFARERGDKKVEIEFLKKAVVSEDGLGYSEPPISISPVRENLGGALLRDNQNTEAELVFREDLRRNPGSGRSMFGLMTAVERQGKKDEAKNVRRQFVEAWKYADIKLTVDSL